jgi:hypothetical protein
MTSEMPLSLIRRKLWLLLLSACCIALCPYTAAQTPIEQVVATYAKQHALEIKLSEDGRLVGPAADWFRIEGAKAQFFFIGEEHDVLEVPLIAGAIWRELVPLGYKHVAIEAGPWLGGRVDRFSRFGDRQALAQFHAATWPRLPNNTVPPISQEDISFYELVGKLTGPHSPAESPLIWGLDYEYRATPLLRRLAELSLPSVKRNRAQPLLDRVEAAEASGNYATASFRTEINELIRLNPTKSGTEKSQIIDALRLRIMDSTERAQHQIKKELFWNNYQAAKQKGEGLPRVMLRFGGYHASRGLMREFGGSTLANYVAELGTTESATMLNVLFVNCQGLTSGSFPRPCTWEEQESLKPFRAAAVGPWTMFDLRGLRDPMRKARLNALQSRPEGSEYWNLVMGFDALVLLRDSERSHIPAN